MSDHISNPDAASGSNIGGYRTAGQRTDKSQIRRDAAIKATKEAWGVSEYVDIFPANIKPLGELGDSAVFNLRQLSRMVPDLAAARLLMTDASIDTSGRPIALSFSLTTVILARLKERAAKEATEKKNKDEEKSNRGSKTTNSSKIVTIPDSLEREKRLTGAVASTPTGGSAGSTDVNNPAATRGLVLGMHSAPGQTVIHAKASLPSKAKAPIPTTHLSQAGKSSSKMGHTSLMGGKYDSKETTSGLHVPSAKDVAPFSGNKLVAVKEPNPNNRVLALEKDNTAYKKPGPKKRVSFALEDEDITPDLLVAEGDRSGQLKSGVRLMTNNESISIDLNTSKRNTCAKRTSDDAEEPPFKKLKFSKETLLAELKFVKRPSPQKDGHPATGETPSEEETEVDEEMKCKLSGDNVAKKYFFGEGNKTKSAGEKGEKKSILDATGAHKLLVARAVNRPKHIKQVRRVLAYNPRDPSSYPELVSPAYRNMEKKVKLPSDHLESPLSPKNSPDREENINSTTGRRLSQIHHSKRAKTTGSFSPNREVHTKLTTSADNKSSDLSTKTSQESSISKKDIMDYNVNEVFDKAEERATNFTKQDDPQLTPKAVVAPARGNIFATPSVTPSKLNTTLPKLPETLTARIPADRALILSIPGVIKAYVKELQTAIPDGVAPDGDLLSMIIVNKYGYFLEHVDKLDKDLNSLYYEAVDRDEEIERKNKERNL